MTKVLSGKNTKEKDRCGGGGQTAPATSKNIKPRKFPEMLNGGEIVGGSGFLGCFEYPDVDRAPVRRNPGDVGALLIFINALKRASRRRCDPIGIVLVAARFSHVS